MNSKIFNLSKSYFLKNNIHSKLNRIRVSKFSFNQFRENLVQQTKMWTKTKIFVHFRNSFEHFAICSKLSRNLFEIFAKFDRNSPDIRKIEKFSWKWGRKFRRIHRNSRGFWTKMNEFCSFIFANFVQRKFRWKP